MFAFLGQRAGEDHQEVYHRARQERIHWWAMTTHMVWENLRERYIKTSESSAASQSNVSTLEKPELKQVSGVSNVVSDVVLQGPALTFLLQTWAPGRGRCPGLLTPSPPPWDIMWVSALTVDLRLQSWTIWVLWELLRSYSSQNKDEDINSAARKVISKHLLQSVRKLQCWHSQRDISWH